MRGSFAPLRMTAKNRQRQRQRRRQQQQQQRWQRRRRVRLEGLVVEGGGVGAGEAEAFTVLFDEAIEVDAFAAAGAGYALAFVAGEFAGG